ncbi:MAG: hypothetical protein HYX50_02175 [Chloroflexi bacterium]|nr:hypothetical protein [Chloroflexota bacterium]
MSRLTDLWRLQETDIALDSRRASRDDAAGRLGQPEDLVALRARVSTLEATLRAAQATQKQVEIEADDLKAKIAPQETKLYSGAIKNPKELADLQADIDQLKRHVSAIEDRDLEALAAVEAAERDYTTGREDLDAMEGAWRAEQAELQAKITSLDGEITDFEEQRTEQAEYIEPELLKQYDRLRKAHQGRAMARLDRNLCMGCRISLPSNMVNKARAGTALVQCPNCERILLT